jgi:hypothetical protein
VSKKQDIYRGKLAENYDLKVLLISTTAHSNGVGFDLGLYHGMIIVTAKIEFEYV